MTRNLKAFGLALAAAMALGAIGAQGASAVVEHSFRSSVNNLVLTAATKSKDTVTLTAGLAIECNGTFEGTNVGTTRDTLTMHPTYSSCTAFGGNASVHTAGCNFILDSDTTQAPGHSTSSEHAAVSVECESSHVIEVTGPGCNVAFAATHSSVSVNQSLHGVRYTNLSSHSGKESGTVSATVKTIHYTMTAGSLCGLVGHPAGTYSGATYTGGSTVTGYEDSSQVSGSTTSGRVWSHGAQVNISVSSPT
jgi:hypothetical protein